jgi:hypothetical protein
VARVGVYPRVFNTTPRQILRYFKKNQTSNSYPYKLVLYENKYNFSPLTLSFKTRDIASVQILIRSTRVSDKKCLAVQNVV